MHLVKQLENFNKINYSLFTWIRLECRTRWLQVGGQRSRGNARKYFRGGNLTELQFRCCWLETPQVESQFSQAVEIPAKTSLGLTECSWNRRYGLSASRNGSTSAGPWLWVKIPVQRTRRRHPARRRFLNTEPWHPWIRRTKNEEGILNVKRLFPHLDHTEGCRFEAVGHGPINRAPGICFQDSFYHVSGASSTWLVILNPERNSSPLKSARKGGAWFSHSTSSAMWCMPRGFVPVIARLSEYVSVVVKHVISPWKSREHSHWVHSEKCFPKVVCESSTRLTEKYNTWFRYLTPCALNGAYFTQRIKASFLVTAKLLRRTWWFHV